MQEYNNNNMAFSSFNSLQSNWSKNKINNVNAVTPYNK